RTRTGSWPLLSYAPWVLQLLSEFAPTLLNKSNKTISAQKNSAMRRLSLRSNADMYAWISSTQGMRELSLMSAYGEFEEWKRPLQQNISPSSKAAQ
ncbi:hypothetical protein P3S36_09695, partial [Enterobacter hormaechei]|nr:hypothetical protein [Enterobacter hormaechei]